MVARRGVLMLALSAACAFLPASARGDGPAPVVVRVDISAGARLATIQPRSAIGSTVDKEPVGSIPRLYSARNVLAMLDAGLGWLSYRLFTELSDQDWHWNPVGHFSAGTAGYWTGSASTRSPPIFDSFGYRLPHRGNTTDQGNNASYSRLDDGDPATYWKSDPYLDQAFTGEADGLHPQWVIVDLGRPQRVGQVRVAWANPYATAYALDTWDGDDPIDDPGTGSWSALATTRTRSAAMSGAPRAGPLDLLRLAEPLNLRYLRLRMWASSQTCDDHGFDDRRNCVGFAIAEIWIGDADAHGVFHDLVHHAACGGESPGLQPCGWRQTATYVSSVDPWHAAADRVRDQEQPGLDLIARSGLTRGTPAMYPVPMLYSTPENAVAEIAYLRARRYPVRAVELGEEPDGQYAAPEDDAALYLQWARAIHKRFPDVKLGGPVFSGVNSELLTWPDAHGDISWLHRFLGYLRSHRALDQLDFMSFEHYPFGGCEHGDALRLDLLQEPSIVKGIVNAWRSDGLPRSVPMYVTEAGFSSANYSQTSMTIEGALWQADYMASALSDGVSGVVYYQYEPVPLSQNSQCPADWGNLTMFVAGPDAAIRARGAQFYASRMLATAWLDPRDPADDLFPASTNLTQGGYPLVTAYAARRPAGIWSVLLVNKDAVAHSVDVRFVRGVDTSRFAGSVTLTSFGPRQYVWRARGAASVPDPDGPPSTTVVRAPSTSGEQQVIFYDVPATSVTVLSGRLLSTSVTIGTPARRAPR